MKSFSTFYFWAFFQRTNSATKDKKLSMRCVGMLNYTPHQTTQGAEESSGVLNQWKSKYALSKNSRSPRDP